MWLRAALDWLDRFDPGGRRRIRGLRLATGVALASMAATLAMPGADSLNAGAAAATLAVWAGVYEAAATRRRAMADLLALVGAGALGAATSAVWTGIVGMDDTALCLLPLAAGAFLVDYLQRYGALGLGAGSMAFIGQTVGFGLGLTDADLTLIAAVGLIVFVSTAILRILGGASERDADALARCRDFRRTLAARLRRYHEALHHDDAAGLARVVPKTAELSAAWAALDMLVRDEFTHGDLIAVYLRTEIKRLYALLQTVLAIGDSFLEMQSPMPAIHDRAAIGLVLHALRRLVLQNPGDDDPALTDKVAQSCDRLTSRAAAAPGLPIETRIALLRIGLATRQGVTAGQPPAQDDPAEPAVAAGRFPGGGLLPTTRVAFQAGLSALTIIALNGVLGMSHPLWALLASTFVISTSVAETWSRGLRRIFGTAVGVALALVMALLFAQAPLIVWALAALAMVIYAMWLPTRYDVACGAYAFALVITLAEAGHSSWNTASARGLDTVVGAAIGMVFSALLLPVRLRDQLGETLALLLTEARDHASAALACATRAGGDTDPEAVTSAGLLAAIEAQKTRFAGLRFEGMLARDGDGGALLLLRIDSLIETTMRLAGEARLAAGHIEPALRETMGILDATLRLAFDAVLDRLRRKARRPVPPSEALLPPLRAAMAALRPEESAATGVLLAAALTYTSRKMIRTLADVAAELDRRDGANAEPVAR